MQSIQKIGIYDVIARQIAAITICPKCVTEAKLIADLVEPPIQADKLTTLANVFKEKVTFVSGFHQRNLRNAPTIKIALERGLASIERQIVASAESMKDRAA